ncbi:MAG: hypothetical protein AAFN78_18740 [Pseudomonadota bacterium]
MDDGAIIGFTLQIIGALSLLALTLLCGLVVWMRLRNPYDKGDTLACAGYPLPARITLQRAIDASDYEEHTPSAERTITRLRSTGFVPVGTFEVAQIPGLMLEAMFHPGSGCAAAVYENGDNEPAFEIIRSYEDGSLLSLTTNTLIDPDTVPPTHHLVSIADLDPGDVLDLVHENDADKPAVPIDDRNFVEVFEQSYAHSMDWKIKHGAYSDAFLQEITRRFVSGNPSEEELEGARATLENALDSEIANACLGNFLNGAPLSAAAWERIRDRVFVIHERMDRHEMLDLIACCVGDRRAQRLFGMFDIHASPDNISLFEKINSALPKNERIAQLGRVDEPVPAAICHTL